MRFLVVLQGLLILTIASGWAVPIEQDFDGITFVKIDTEQFIFGSPYNQSFHKPTEQVRVVPFSHSFWISKYEVTQSEWQSLMPSNPSSFKSLGNPVETITWQDAKDFVAVLNQQAGANHYRLPTEAEWEYVAKAGGYDVWSFGDLLEDLGTYTYRDGVHNPRQVGQKEGNVWGVYDLYGNVYEWIEDWYQYSLPKGFGGCPPSEGTYKVIRGGSNACDSVFLRSASRQFAKPNRKGYYIGMRLVRVDDPAQDPYQPDTLCSPMPFCGDGIIQAGEQCDDGNLDDGDECSSSCDLTGVCGDGILNLGEECDDGNQIDLDACSAQCKITNLPVCGNGVVNQDLNISFGSLNPLDQTVGYSYSLAHYADDVGDRNPTPLLKAFNGNFNSQFYAELESTHGLVSVYKHNYLLGDDPLVANMANFYTISNQFYNSEVIEVDLNGAVIATGFLIKHNDVSRITSITHYDEDGIERGTENYLFNILGIYDYEITIDTPLEQLPLFEGVIPPLSQDNQIPADLISVEWSPATSNVFDFCQINGSYKQGLYCNQAGELLSSFRSNARMLGLDDLNPSFDIMHSFEYDYQSRTVTVYSHDMSFAGELLTILTKRFDATGHLVQESNEYWGDYTTYDNEFFNQKRRINHYTIIEHCDDGNLVDGDGCSSSCQLEICGNGTLELNEECDDANEVNGDGCSSNCTFETEGAEAPLCEINMNNGNLIGCPSQQDLQWHTVAGGEVTIMDSFGQESTVNVPTFVYSTALTYDLYTICESRGFCNTDALFGYQVILPEDRFSHITQAGELDWYEAVLYGNWIGASLPSEAQLALLMKREAEVIAHNNDPQAPFIPFYSFVPYAQNLWTLDEWHDSLQGIPTNGSAWMTRIAGYPIPFYRPRVTKQFNVDPLASSIDIQRTKLDPVDQKAFAIYVKPLAHNGIGGMGCEPQVEICDGIDNDCDGQIDNGFPADCLP